MPGHRQGWVFLALLGGVGVAGCLPPRVSPAAAAEPNEAAAPTVLSKGQLQQLAQTLDTTAKQEQQQDQAAAAEAAKHGLAPPVRAGAPIFDNCEVDISATAQICELPQPQLIGQPCSCADGSGNVIPGSIVSDNDVAALGLAH